MFIRTVTKSTLLTWAREHLGARREVEGHAGDGLADGRDGAAERGERPRLRSASSATRSTTRCDPR